MHRKNINKLIDEALAIEAESAMKAGTIGFMCRALTIATMPHKKPTETTYKRRNGTFTLTMVADPDIGLPYGTKPRLLMAWVSTEAVKTKNRNLYLGKSLAEFMGKLGLARSGGKRGQITGFKTQAERLFACAISARYVEGNRRSRQQFMLTDGYDLWWQPRQPNQHNLFTSCVTLSERFYKEIASHPIPLDLRALNALSRSPLALDIYVWLTYRLSYLEKPTSVPWEILQAQFGADYAHTDQGRRDFKRAFIRQLVKVLAVYPTARTDETPLGLRLLPSRSHIPKRRNTVNNPVNVPSYSR